MIKKPATLIGERSSQNVPKTESEKISMTKKQTNKQTNKQKQAYFETVFPFPVKCAKCDVFSSIFAFRYSNINQR